MLSASRFLSGTCYKRNPRRTGSHPKGCSEPLFRFPMACGVTRERLHQREPGRNDFVLELLFLFVDRSRSSVHASNTHLINYSHFQIIICPHLARQPDILSQLSFNREPIAFEF